MILTAGLSPAWQQILVVDQLRTGDLNRARQAYWCGSGKVLNAAVAIHHLTGREAERSLVLSTLGGPAYDPIDAEFETLAIRRRWVRTKSPTRVCTTVVDRSTGFATELIENAGEISSNELDEFEAAFAEAAAGATAVLLIGSLPRGAPTDYFRRLLKHVRCPAVLDVRGPELLASLEEEPTLVKPNREELARTLGIEITSVDELKQAMVELQRRGARAVVTTSGGETAWVADGNDVYGMIPLPVERIVNPIGCGDCMAAGIACALAAGQDVMIAVEEGLDAATRNLRTLLPSDFDRHREKLALR